MTPETSVPTLLSRLKAPAPDLDKLSIGAAKPAKLQAWVDALPRTRVSYVTSLLYRLLPEVVRLRVAPEQRLELLEILRPVTFQAVEGLSRQFLNQPLILPQPARKTATVAQALQKHLSNGYLAAVRDLCREPGEKEIKNELLDRQALVVHRGVTGLGWLLLRSYQLYTPIPDRLWLEIHSLYQLALALNLTDRPVPETLPHHTKVNKVATSYKRLLLLACAHPNQLRQTEISDAYQALEPLALQARLLEYQPGQDDNLFALVLDNDAPPLYKSRLPNEISGPALELDTGPVVAALEAERASQAGRGGGLNSLGLTLTLNEHLIQSWQLRTQRSFERQPASGAMELTVGLSNLHFHLTGGLSFNLFMNKAAHVQPGSQGPFARKLPLGKTDEDSDDPWGSAFDAGGGRLGGESLGSFNIESRIRKHQQQDYRGEHPTYQVPIVDLSPGGCCLEWREQMPVQLKAGELLGLREQGRHKWSIGVVRWIQQAKDATLLGVQTLAPQANPLGAAVIQKMGGYSEFLRALEIPPFKAINQPATLLVNSVSFHEYNKIRLYRYNSGEAEDNTKTQSTVQLTRRRFSTAAISQFEFRQVSSGSTDKSETR